MLTEGGRSANISSLYGFTCIQLGDYLGVETVLNELTTYMRGPRKPGETNNRLTNWIAGSGEGFNWTRAPRTNAARSVFYRCKCQLLRNFLEARGCDYP